MKIKVPVKPYQREIIESDINNLKKSLVRDEKNYKKEVERVNKLIKDRIKFWETNDVPVYDWKAEDDERKIDLNKSYETEIVWGETGTISISTLEKMYRWLCKYCGEKTHTKRITTGHDHTDYSYNVCDCEGAKKHGKPYKELD